MKLLDFQATAPNLGCGAPAAAALVNNIERAAALRAAHRRSIESMLRRVLQMQAVQTEADIIATSVTNLDQLETHLRYSKMPSSSWLNQKLPTLKVPADKSGHSLLHYIKEQKLLSQLLFAAGI